MISIKRLFVSLAAISLLTGLAGCAADAPDESEPTQGEKNVLPIEVNKGNDNVDPKLISVDKYGWACINYSNGSYYCCTTFESGRKSCYSG